MAWDASVLAASRAWAASAAEATGAAAGEGTSSLAAASAPGPWWAVPSAPRSRLAGAARISWTDLS
eukprot:609066-Pyramimonas_sp.AAC.1